MSITGPFSGRNLLGEMPDAPGKSRYDFVLRSTDAALWITNMRPKVKDAAGKDMELGLDARIDTGRWLTVRGTMQQSRGLLLLDAEAGSLSLAKPPTETHTGLPGFNEPGPDFCHTGAEPQLAIGVIGMPSVSASRTVPVLPAMGSPSGRVVTVPSG